MAARRKGVSAVLGTGRHRLVGGEEKGDGGGSRGSNGFRVGIGFGRRGVKWGNQFEWSGVEWSGRVNAPRLTTGWN